MTPAHLLIVRGPDTGLRIELDAGRLTIGSHPSSDLALDSPTVAPYHAILHGAVNSFRFTSSAPSFCNGVPVTACELADGDRLRLGEVELLFQAPREATIAANPLVSACSLFYLFRAMHGLAAELQVPLEAQIRSIARQHLGAGILDVFVEGTREDWSAQLAARGRAVPLEHSAAALAQVIQFGPQQYACLVWHCEDPAPVEDAFAAFCALSSAALETASEISNLELRTTLAESQLASRTGILGSSPAVQTLLRQIEKVAPRETTILIQGESGTGKELVARAIHRLSPRASRPFLALNCAAIAENLLESELFGHEKGAFTGATELRPGKLELAAGGTVFLDEIGEMPLPLQAKMLRVLQQRECERVGGRKVIPLDIRIVAATNRDLAAEVKQGRFREDLYHRLNVVSLRTPPLRERGEDIAELAHAFLARSAAAASRQVSGFTPDALAALRRHDWPGNIRELENVIERAVVLGDLPLVQLEDLPDSLGESQPDAPAFHRTVHDAKRQAIVDAWRLAGGDYKLAATTLGVHPNSLLRMIRNLNLRAELNA